MCLCYRAVLHHAQTGSEVSEADVTVHIQQDVVRFDVSVTQKQIQNINMNNSTNRDRGVDTLGSNWLNLNNDAVC